MRLCSCAAVYPDRERAVVGHKGCAVCRGRGVVTTEVTAELRAELAAAGWSVDRNGELRHARYGRARVEAALALMESDRKAAKRAAERMATT